MSRAFSRVCLFVRPRSKRKTASAINTKLGTYILYIVTARHPLTQMSKVKVTYYENRHSRTVAQLLVTRAATAVCCSWICMSIRLPMLSSFSWVRLGLKTDPVHACLHGTKCVDSHYAIKPPGHEPYNGWGPESANVSIRDAHMPACCNHAARSVRLDVVRLAVDQGQH